MSQRRPNSCNNCVHWNGHPRSINEQYICRKLSDVRYDMNLRAVALNNPGMPNPKFYTQSVFYCNLHEKKGR